MSNATRRKQEQARKATAEKRSRFHTTLGMAFGLVSWGYFVLAPNPNFLFGALLIVCGAGFFAVAIWEYFESRKVKVVFTACLIIGLSSGLIWGNEQTWIKKALDISNGLKVSIHSISSKAVWESVVSVSNDSQVPIQNMKISCVVIKLKDSHNNIYRGYTAGPYNVASDLAPGGDTQSTACMTTAFHFTGDMICADLTVVNSYTLAGRPEERKEKESRFVARNEFGTITWYGMALSHNGSYCD